ncbi:MAG: response regulator transcription factor [Planctomycetia bacterium]|nr:response regulator transcription factor [Planctomycetia bacterium]
MRILVAEDDPVSRRLLEVTLRKWGHEPEVAQDGLQAWEALRRPDRASFAILDLMMPGLSGIEVCRRARALGQPAPLYVILLTARSETETVVEALEAGADDYVLKPFTPDELRARIGAGARVVDLEQKLAGRVEELERALAEVRELRQLLPMCSYCKKVRNDGNFWERVENYIGTRMQARVSHSVCPECAEKFLRDDPGLMGPSSQGR